MPSADLLNPALQYGALGLCFVLILLVGWLTKRLLDVLKEHSDVLSNVGGIIERNTAAVEKLAANENESIALMRQLNNKLLARPCIARKEEGGGS